MKQSQHDSHSCTVFAELCLLLTKCRHQHPLSHWMPGASLDLSWRLRPTCFTCLTVFCKKKHLCPFVVTFAERSWCWQPKASADLEWLLYLSNLVTTLYWIACCSRAPIIFSRKNAGEWIHRVCASPPLCLSMCQAFLISSLLYTVFCSLANFTFLVEGLQTIPCGKPVQPGGVLFIETSKSLSVNWAALFLHPHLPLFGSSLLSCGSPSPVKADVAWCGLWVEEEWYLGMNMPYKQK